MPGFGFSPSGQPQKKRDINPLEILDRVLDLGVTDAIDEARARRDRPEMMARRMAEIEALGLDPREAAIARLNPEAWTKEGAKRYGSPTVAAPGSAVLMGDDPMQFVPKTEMAGDTPVTTVGEQVTYGAPRPPSYEEKARALAEQAKRLLDEKRLEGQLTRWSAMTGQGAERVGLSRAAGARAAARGGSAPAGASAGKPWEKYGRGQ
jgi:hypothetical protein